MVITGSSVAAYGYYEIPSIVGWGFLCAGGGLVYLSLLGIYRNWGKKPPHYTEEDITRAEASLDALYLSTHGKYPDKTGTILQPGESEQAQNAAGEKPGEGEPLTSGEKV